MVYTPGPVVPEVSQVFCLLNLARSTRISQDSEDRKYCILFISFYTNVIPLRDSRVSPYRICQGYIPSRAVCNAIYRAKDHGFILTSQEIPRTIAANKLHFFEGYPRETNEEKTVKPNADRRSMTDVFEFS